MTRSESDASDSAADGNRLGAAAPPHWPAPDLCVLCRPALLCAILLQEIDPFQLRPRLPDGSGFQLERHRLQSDHAFLGLRLLQQSGRTGSDLSGDQPVSVRRQPRHRFASAAMDLAGSVLHARGQRGFRLSAVPPSRRAIGEHVDVLARAAQSGFSAGLQLRRFSGRSARRLYRRRQPGGTN